MERTKNSSQPSAANPSSGGKRGGGAEPVLPLDSDDHDDFNPIQDLMPPSIVGSSDLDQIGKKRGRENDPLRRLVEDTNSEDELNVAAAHGPHKRQKLAQDS